MLTPEEELEERANMDSEITDDQEDDWWCFECDEYRCKHGLCRNCEGCDICDPEPEEEPL